MRWRGWKVSMHMIFDPYIYGKTIYIASPLTWTRHVPHHVSLDDGRKLIEMPICNLPPFQFNFFTQTRNKNVARGV